MSLVVVQLGQCGNQIGTELFSTVYTDALSTCRPSFSKLLLASSERLNESSYCQESVNRFFYERDHGQPPTARAVLVDMETKVVQKSLLEAERRGSWLYDSASVYQGRRGSGNNWANGYCQYGPRLCEQIMTLVQREVEKCDHFWGFLVVMSVAGGTGSGLGTYITNQLKECYPNSVVINIVVWPYVSGEVIVQNYNALLTTANLYDSANAILVLQNDQLHRICSKLLLLKEITFMDVNRVVSHSLASLFQPAIPYDVAGISGDARAGYHPLLWHQSSLSNMVSLLTPHPNYKLLSVRCVPQMPERSHAFSRYLWPGLLKYQKQMLITNSSTDEGMDWGVRLGEGSSQAHISRSLANLLILRGKELDLCDPLSSGVFDSRMYSDIVPPSLASSTWCSPHPFNRYEKSCTVLSNSQSCVPPLEVVTQKAWRMFSSKAYVHQYRKYGLSEDQFMEAFVSVEHTLECYKRI